MAALVSSHYFIVGSKSPKGVVWSSSAAGATRWNCKFMNGKTATWRSVHCSSSSTSEEAAISTTTTTDSNSNNWIPVVPLTALPKGERRLIRQDDLTILLLWYKDTVYAIENKSPAEGAYSEGLLYAKLTADGCIVCPSTSSTFDLKTGAIKEWYPTNPVMKLLLKPTKQLDVFPVKMDEESIYIDMQNAPDDDGQASEIVLGRKNSSAGKTADDIFIQEVRMVVDQDQSTGFGFTPANEITNGRAAMMGFSVLLIFELVTGKGFLKGTGFLDFLYQYF